MARAVACCLVVLPACLHETAVFADPRQEDGDAERIRMLQQLYDEALLPTDDRENGAIAYRHAFDLLAEIQGLDDQVIALLDRIEHEPGRAYYHDPETQRLLELSAPAIEYARLGSNLGYAEFGIDRDQGINALMPHLSPMRQLSRLMMIQSNALRATGSADEAAAIVADMLRLSRHVSSDEVLVGSLVGVSCASMGYDAIEDAVARGEIDSESAQILLSSLDSDKVDQFSFADAIESEYELMTNTISDMDDPGSELFDLLTTFSDDEDLDGLQGIDEDMFEDSIALMEPAYAHAADAFRETDPDKARAAVKELEIAVQSGEYGELARLIMPSLSMALEAKLRSDMQIERYETMLRAIASGVDPAEFANAAVIYEPAFRYLRRIRAHDQELMEMIRQVVAVTGSCEALPKRMVGQIQSTLEESAQVVMMLRKAASYRRCSWKRAERARQYGRIIPEGEWVRPMRAAARLLMADAALSACMAEAGVEGSEDQLARSLADALAVTLHLADGSHLFGQVVAAGTLVELADLIETIAGKGLLTNEGRDLLRERLARIDGGDPLGWSSAREGMMQPQLFGVVASFGMRDESDALRLVRNWSLDRLVALGFVERSHDEEEFGFSLEIDGPDAGSFFSVEELISANEEELGRFKGHHQRLIDLLALVDTTQPVEADLWKANSMGALERISRAASSIDAHQEP